MPARSRTFRVFVSSTFSDFHEEREALRRLVFPRLRALCRTRAATFQVVDLRWGVSRHAAESHQTIGICLKEIERCQALTAQPNFIVLLGDRYGWRPLPEVIPGDEWIVIERWLLAHRPATREVLRGMYTRDDNAVPPCYRIGGRLAVARRNPASGDDLRLALRDAVAALPFTPGQRRRYTSSATEQEIAHRGLLDAPADQRGAYCFARTIDDLPRDERAEVFLDFHPDGTFDEGSHALAGALKDQLRQHLPGRFKEYRPRWADGRPSRGYLREFCSDVYQCLSSAIQSELSTRTDSGPLDDEIAEHASFANERQRVFIGRVDALDAAARYLAAPSRHPLVIHGESGSGKSALMSRLISRAADSHSAAVVFRFIGAVPGSTNVRTLLESVSRELARIGGVDDNEGTRDYEALCRDFTSRLNAPPSGQRLILFLDALDQLSPLYGARTLNWLPRTLPDNVHVVLSTVPGDVLDGLRATVPDTHRYQLRGMPHHEGGALLDVWLTEAKRALQPQQRSHVLAAFETNGLPLYLRLAFEEARLWPSHAPPAPLAPDVAALIRATFRRLAGSANHGAALVSRSLAYIAAGRDGLAHEELLEVLSADGVVMKEFRASSPDSPRTDALPDIVWSRLYLDLAAYLTERAAGGSATLDFFHRQLREVVEQEYLAGERTQRHRVLAAYFGTQNNIAVSGRSTAPNLRKLSELPFQLAHAGMHVRLDRLLTSFDFIHAKVAGIGVPDLIEDFERARAVSGAAAKPHLGIVQEALRLSASSLSRDPALLPSQLLGRLRGTTHQRLRRLLRETEGYRDVPWLNPLTPSLTAPGGPLIGSLVLDSPIGSASMNPDGTAVLVGCHDGSLRLIDLERRVEVRRLAIHTGPITDVAYFPEHQRSLSICPGNAVALCDLREGTHRACAIPVDEFKRLAATPDARHAVLIGGFLNRESHINHGVASLRAVEDDGELRRWQGEEGNFCTAAISTDGTRVITGTTWGVIQLWSSDRDRALQKFRTNDGSAMAIALAPDPEIALIATGDQSSGQYNVRLWDISKWEELHVFKGHHWMVTAVAITPDGRIGASGAYDAVVRLWDLAERKQLAYLRGHAGRVESLHLSRDGKFLLSTAGHSLFHWSLDKARSTRQLAGHMERVSSVSVSADGRTVISRSSEGTIGTWDLMKHRLKFMKTAPKQERGPQTIHARLPDGRHAIASQRDGRLCLIELRTGREVREFHGRKDPSGGVLVLDRGRRILADCGDFTLGLWDGETGTRLAKLKNGTGAPAMAATPDGRRAVSGTQYGRVHVWDLVRGKKIGELAHHQGGNWTMMAVAITPDGEYALSGGDDTLIRVWNLNTRTCIATFAVEDHSTDACAAGDRLFIVGSRNGAVHMLALNTSIRR